MNEEKKNGKGEKQNNLVYALADYKQLVIQYRTTHAELVRSRSFWKTTAFWVSILAFAGFAFGLVMFIENKRQTAKNISSLAAMSSRLENLSERFEGREKELAAVRAELETKNARINQLEKNISTMSKSQAEKLLKNASE